MRVNWDRTPVSVHHDDKNELESLIIHLRNNFGIRKRSLVMNDHEEGGFLFFLYQPCNPRWILEYEELESKLTEEE